MVMERETAEQMFERHLQERDKFLVDQAQRLNKSGYDWKLPPHFQARFMYGGKGFVIKDNYEEQESGILPTNSILTPDGKYAHFSNGGQILPWPAGRHLSKKILVLIEQRVDEALSTSVPAST